MHGLGWHTSETLLSVVLHQGGGAAPSNYCRFMASFVYMIYKNVRHRILLHFIFAGNDNDTRYIATLVEHLSSKSEMWQPKRCFLEGLKSYA